jgi:hypothetical protein
MGIVSQISNEQNLGIIKMSPGLIRKGVNSFASDDINSKNKYAIGLILLVLVAILSAILTGFALNQYTSTYSVIMKTDIGVYANNFSMDNETAMLNLTVMVSNPTRKNMTVNRIEFDVKLNGKYMMEQNVLRSIPKIEQNDVIEFYNLLRIPKNRWFTLEEAISKNNWDWQITGTGYIDTMFGETLLRFRTKSNIPPYN